ncbi:MAG TPA: TRAP transporter large permease subunit, partial [Rhodocyclaceae bacterium]|nr:TRAP transporter large permease subunit [Rhodocyclaceae bacterium]
ASIMLITLPIILPLLKPLGIDPVHFAVVMTINMEIALITPPVGLNLYVIASVAKAPIGEAIRGITPFLIMLLGLLATITYVPEISLWLPDLADPFAPPIGPDQVPASVTTRSNRSRIGSGTGRRPAINASTR